MDINLTANKKLHFYLVHYRAIFLDACDVTIFPIVDSST